jgi:hypothetical protein
MMGPEIDMLEVLLHEVYPVVDYILIVESNVSHSLKRKPLYFNEVVEQWERFGPFMNKLLNFSKPFSLIKESSSPRRRPHRIRSGWEIERRQRNAIMKLARYYQLLADGDIFVGNGDLDEIVLRRTLMRMKYCEPSSLSSFHHRTFFNIDVVHFRYNFNCLPETRSTVYRGTVFPWNAENRLRDLYEQRKNKTELAFDGLTAPGAHLASVLQSAASVLGTFTSDYRRFDFEAELQRRDGSLALHLSTFGSPGDILVKLSNSPHKHTGTPPLATIEREVESCSYNEVARRKERVPTQFLPIFVQRNLCRFTVEKRWVRGQDYVEAPAAAVTIHPRTLQPLNKRR